ncbi:hypothetical protein BASA84_000578 [Batrachochytrium salamandrivorans]|nr:hypothetical protein BASA84_000578 [Batrachochytrium salamandrivorans]
MAKRADGGGGAGSAVAATAAATAAVATAASVSAAGGRHLATLVRSLSTMLAPAAAGLSPAAIQDHNRMRWLLMGSLALIGIVSTTRLLGSFSRRASSDRGNSNSDSVHGHNSSRCVNAGCHDQRSNHKHHELQDPQELQMDSVDTNVNENDALVTSSEDTQTNNPNSARLRVLKTRHSSNRLSRMLVPITDWDSIMVQRIVDFLINPAESGRVGSQSSPVQSMASSPLPLFLAQQDHLVSEIQSAKRLRHPLLVEGGPGIGKGAALLTLIQREALIRPAFYLKLDDVLPKLAIHQTMPIFQYASFTTDATDSLVDHPDHYSTADDSPNDNETPLNNSAYIADSWRSALETTFGLDYLRQEQLYDADGEPLDMLAASLNHVAEALRHIRAKSRYGPALLVIDNLQLLFKDHEPLVDIYSAFISSFSWLLQCETEGVLDIIFCSSCKSVMPAMKRFPGYDRRLRYRSVESVDDLDVLDYLLDQVNPTLPVERQFTEASANRFVETFDGNLTELARYCQGEGYHLEMIMRNGVLSLAAVDLERLSLIEILVEKNFLRWRDARARKRWRDRTLTLKLRRTRAGSIASGSGASFDMRSDQSGETGDEDDSRFGRSLEDLTETDVAVMEQLVNDPFAFLRRV